MKLSLNRCVAMFLSCSNSEISSFSERETLEIMFSLAKLWGVQFLIYMKRSFMNKLKRTRPRIESCGTSFQVGNGMVLLKTYASIFTIKSSCRMQSKPLDKPTNIALTFFCYLILFSSFLLIL